MWLFAERMKIPLLPFIQPDSRSYLTIAIHWATEGELIHIGGRQFGYPLFVGTLLRLFDDVRAITLVQHGLGVLGSLLLLLAWLRMPLPTGAPVSCLWVQRGLGLVLMVAQGLNAQTMVFEHHIQPESISQMLGALMLLGLVSCFANDPNRAPGRFVLWATVGLFAANVLALVRPQGLLVVPATGLCVLAFALVRRARPMPLAASVGVPAVLSLGLLWGPELALVGEDSGARGISAQRFLFWHFHIAKPVIEGDLAAGGDDPDHVVRRQLLDAFAAEEERHAREARRYHFQSYNPCALFYGDAGRSIREHFKERPEELESFSMGAFTEGVRARPSAYLAKIGHNLATFYRFDDKIVPNPRGYVKVAQLLETSGTLGERMQSTLDRMPQWTGYVDALAATAAAWPESKELVWISGARKGSEPYFLAYQLLGLAHTPALLALMVGLFLPRAPDDGVIAWTAVTSAAALFGVLVTASALHGLETHRYMLAVANLAIFSTFTALWLTGNRVWALALSRRGAQTGSSPGGPSASDASR